MPNLQRTSPSSVQEGRWQVIAAKMAAQAHLLARQGALASRAGPRRREWSVRFTEQLVDGRSVQRAIYVGSDPVVVQKARDLLKHYRQRRRWPEELARYTRYSASMMHMIRQLVRQPRYGIQRNTQQISAGG